MRCKVISFGCRLNSSESEKIEKIAAEIGLSNYIIINTCAVTAEAERKLKQTISKIVRETPDVKIVLTGCASSLNPEDYLKIPSVMGVIPNSLKLLKSEYLKFSDEYNNQVQNISSNEKIRGFLQIQNGCDHKCTYCVIRIARGPSLSFNISEILSEAEELIRLGYVEIVLTGVNITSFGDDLDNKQNLSFLIREILKKVPSIRRLGLSSLDPADIDDELMKIIASEEKIMPYIHESIQSGDNLILKRMNRRHNREKIIDVNQRLLQMRNDIVFGADMIVGFPTETNEMFNNSCSLLSEARISLAHIFPFSPRPDTPAYKMPQVSRGEITSRAKIMKKISKNILAKKLSSFIGKKINFVAEKNGMGRTPSFLRVKTNKEIDVGKDYEMICIGVDEESLIC